MQQSLQALREQALECQNCRLCQTRHNVVFGAGNPNAAVMFIGEGPGEQEDLTGEPFVGRGGQLLDRMLAVVDLDRKHNIYIANMVKCRPPQNRDPQKDEVAACMPYLRSQVKYIRPKIIVCLGRVAASSLIDPQFRVTRQHGEFVERNGVWMMGTFHPAALLRNPTQKPAALQDLQRLQEKILQVAPQTYQQPASV